MSLPMTLPMSISRNHKISLATQFDSESGIWTPPVGRQNDHELSDDHEDIIDNIEDIFTLSGKLFIVTQRFKNCVLGISRSLIPASRSPQF